MSKATRKKPVPSYLRPEKIVFDPLNFASMPLEELERKGWQRIKVRPPRLGERNDFGKIEVTL